MIIERNKIVFKQNITEKELLWLPADFTGEIIVYGNVKFCDDFEVPCSLLVNGELQCGELTIKGNLRVDGGIDFEEIHITKDFIFNGNSYPDIDCFGGDIIVDGNCIYTGEASFDSIFVAGKLQFNETKKVNGKNVVWQKIECNNIKISRIEI